MPGHLGLFVCLTVALNIFIRRPRLWAIYDLHTANEELGLIIYTNPCVRSDTGCRQPLFKTNGPGVNSTTPDVWVFQPHSGKNSVLNVGSKNITGQLFFILAKMRNGICKVGPRIFFFFLCHFAGQGPKAHFIVPEPKLYLFIRCCTWSEFDIAFSIFGG